ncbi:hypothetical protein E2C01_085834 [Portunus trituberculatus]|uniref:Uncharacterized protein n=1 Tax=Portunus trituberculatus TaxID=210409 RepID=A0A5B7IZ65_PORTR|nr:hypothetical protein [Portunus trituberculatus]
MLLLCQSRDTEYSMRCINSKSYIYLVTSFTKN